MPAAAPKMIDFFNIPALCRTSPNVPPVFPDHSQWKHTQKCVLTWMLSSTFFHWQKRVNLSLWGGGGEGKCGFSNTFADCSTECSHPPTLLSHLSMNFWKILPLKLSQISTMYGCRGTDTQTADQAKYLPKNNVICEMM